MLDSECFIVNITYIWKTDYCLQAPKHRHIPRGFRRFRRVHPQAKGHPIPGGRGEATRLVRNSIPRTHEHGTRRGEGGYEPEERCDKAQDDGMWQGKIGRERAGMQRGISWAGGGSESGDGRTRRAGHGEAMRRYNSPPTRTPAALVTPNCGRLAPK